MNSRTLGVWLLWLVVSCDRPGSPAPASPPPSAAPPAAATLLGSAPRLLTAIVGDWDSTRATLRLWRRDGDRWRAVGKPWPGVIGRTGAAWGDGLHGTGAPAGRAGPIKYEGDDKSPAGVFELSAAYGYAPAAPSGTSLPYVGVDASWNCIDDPASRHYNTVLDRRTVEVDWSSHEEMRRDDELYTWVVEVAHNPSRTAKRGSCIFLHVWGGEASATAGCTAMDAHRLATLIGQLDPRAAFVLLPRDEYVALTDAWHLPAL